MRPELTYKPVDLARYPRKRIYEAFKDLANPYFSLTANVDITSFLKAKQKNKLPFFLAFQRLAVEAMDSDVNFRIRFKDGALVEISHTVASYALALSDETFSFVGAYPYLDKEAYYKDALIHQEEGRKNPDMKDDPEEVLFMAFLSCLPWISFTSLTHEAPSPADANPRLTFLKYFRQGRNTLLP